MHLLGLYCDTMYLWRSFNAPSLTDYYTVGLMAPGGRSLRVNCTPVRRWPIVMILYLATAGSLPAVAANKPPERWNAGRWRSQRTRFAPSASVAGVWWTARWSFTSTTTLCEKFHVLLLLLATTLGGVNPQQPRIAEHFDLFHIYL